MKSAPLNEINTPAIKKSAVKKYKKMRLSELHKGESGIIDSFTNDDMKLKLLEMGCLPGEKVRVTRYAPLGCPIAIKVSDYTLSLRMDEAETIMIRKEI